MTSLPSFRKVKKPLLVSGYLSYLKVSSFFLLVYQVLFELLAILSTRKILSLEACIPSSYRTPFFVMEHLIVLPGLCLMLQVVVQVEHLTRDQNSLAAYELISLFCQLVVDRLLIIKEQR